MTSQDLYATTPAPIRVKQTASNQLLTLTVMSHPNLARIGEICYLHGSKIQISRTKPDFTAVGALHGLPLADPFISRDPLEVAFHDGTVLLSPGQKTLISIWGEPLTEARRQR